MLFPIPIPNLPKCWFCQRELSQAWQIPHQGPHYYFCDNHQDFTVRYQIWMMHPYGSNIPQEAHLTDLIISRHNLRLSLNLNDHLNRLNHPTPNPDYGKCKLVMTGNQESYNYLGLELPNFWPLDKSDQQIVKKMDQLKELKVFL